MKPNAIKSFFDRSYHRLFNSLRCHYLPGRNEKYNETFTGLDSYVYRALGRGWFLQSKFVVYDMSGGYDGYYTKAKRLASVVGFQYFLKEKDARQDFREWAKDKTIQEAIDQCHRGDWLLLLARMLCVEKRLLIGAAGRCANTVRRLMKNEASRKCVDVCIKYGNGEVTDEELIKARAAAEASDLADLADLAAAEASDLTDLAAVWAATASAAAAAAAAWAAVWAATASAAATATAAAAAAEAREQNQRQTADICRKHLKEAMLQKWTELHQKQGVITKHK